MNVRGDFFKISKQHNSSDMPVSNVILRGPQSE